MATKKKSPPKASDQALIVAGEPVAEMAKTNKQTDFPFGANVQKPKTTYKRQSTLTKGAKAMAKKPTKKKPGRKAGGVNKSAAIRDYAAAHPKASTQDIADALTAKLGLGEKAYNYVYQVTKGNGKKKKAKPGSTAKAATGANNGHTASSNGASDLVHQAFALGLDKAIAVLQKVKDAIG